LKKGDPANNDTDWDRMIKMWYFGITTLATIGYGDIAPVNAIERFVFSFVLLFGVSIYSFIMG
jgi:hypothetical protein